MVTINLLTGELIRQSTSNWKELNVIDCYNLRRWHSYAVVGKRVFKYLFSWLYNKSFVVSLDTESLEWKIVITLNGVIDQLISDRTRTLMVRVRTNPQDRSVVQYYRFVMDGPEKLSTLVWFQLKKMFDAHPSLYEVVLSKLPANFKLKHTPL
ncbi:hypothetical protein M3Y95_00854300 [Aphelenchoides besseyi]|nr:hypothetical protein M3Y95_00854300 [Aphelenchoides besseyi]